MKAASVLPHIVMKHTSGLFIRQLALATVLPIVSTQVFSVLVQWQNQPELQLKAVSYVWHAQLNPHASVMLTCRGAGPLQRAPQRSRRSEDPFSRSLQSSLPPPAAAQRRRRRVWSRQVPVTLQLRLLLAMQPSRDAQDGHQL